MERVSLRGAWRAEEGTSVQGSVSEKPCQEGNRQWKHTLPHALRSKKMLTAALAVLRRLVWRGEDAPQCVAPDALGRAPGSWWPREQR